MGFWRGFRKLFRPFAKDEDYYAHFERIAKLPLDSIGIFAALKRELGKPEGGILDFGCGLGYVAQSLGAVGVEANAKAVDLARARFPQTEFHLKSIPELKGWRTFGAVLCVNVIEHLEDADREAFFGLLPGLLKPGGRVFFVYDDMYHPLQVLSALRRPGTLLLDPTHVHCWTQAAFRRLISKDFEVEKELGGNIQSLTLPWGNRFSTARLYVCRARREASFAI